MTMRSCLHPMIGNQVNGWVGDIIDAMSIVVVVFGVCTSLGLGAMQIVTGLTRLQIVPQDASSEVITNTSLVVIWIITAVAATSVALGVHRGIKPLSQVCLCGVPWGPGCGGGLESCLGFGEVQWLGAPPPPPQCLTNIRCLARIFWFLG